MSERQRTARREATVEAAGETATDMTVMAAAASVLLALHQYFIRGNRDRGIFVGLWAPTILAFGSYFNQRRIEERVQQVGPGSIIDSLEERIGGR